MLLNRPSALCDVINNNQTAELMRKKERIAHCSRLDNFKSFNQPLQLHTETHQVLSLFFCLSFVALFLLLLLMFTSLF